MLKEHTEHTPGQSPALLNHISARLGKTVMATALSLTFNPSKACSKLLEWREAILLGLLIGVIGAGISLTSLGEELEEGFGLSWLFALRGPLPAPPEVVVVAIDRASSRQLGLPIMPSLWPRTLHAGLIEYLSQAGAKLVAFDLRFDSPGAVPEDDLVLAEAMRQAGNVVIVERLDQEDDLFPGGEDAAYHGSSIEKPALPIPVIAEAAAAHAAFPLPRASRVNHYWAFKTTAGDAPTLPVIVLQLAALDAYDDFLRLLRNVSPSNGSALPGSAKETAVEDLVLALRGIFTGEPDLAQQIRAQLENDASIDPKNKRLIQSMISLYAGPDIRYLNFYGPPRTVPTIPYHRALRALTGTEITKNDFKDKIIFVGFSAASQTEQDRIRDDYHTVFSQADGLFISGIEIAATAFSNLLDDRSIQPMENPANVAWVFFWGFAIALGFAALSHRNPKRLALRLAAASIGLAVGYCLVAQYQFREQGAWLPMTAPLIQLLLAIFGTIFLKYHASRQDYKTLKENCGVFLPERIMNGLAKQADPVTSHNQLVYGTCLATDAEMYTSLAENMKPAQLGALMNDYYSTIFEPVSRYDGIVTDVVGDAMLAAWAASKDLSLREKACLASLDIVQAIDRFNQVEGRPRLPTRIGLHSGEMYLGTVGALNHYEYRAVGDMVNTTNRIQGLNKYLGTRLLASDEVLEGLDDFLARPLGCFLLAGKTVPVRVVELMGRKQEASSKQVWLCEIFAHAMRAYESQEWPGGCHSFSEILREFQDDGPSRFYLKRCQDYRVTAPVGPWDASIRITEK